jgi:hypothetical protein
VIAALKAFIDRTPSVVVREEAEKLISRLKH